MNEEVKKALDLILKTLSTEDTEEKTEYSSELAKKVFDMFGKSLTGQVLSCHEIPQGSIVQYEKDINISAVTTDEYGEKFELRTKGDRVFPFTFQVVGKGDTEEEAIQSIIEQCDEKAKKLLIYASTIENKPLIFYNDIENWKELVNNLTYKVERHRLLVDKIIVGRDKLTSMRKHMNVIDFSPELSKEELAKGNFGEIYGMQVFIDTLLPNVIIAITEKQNLGAVPFRAIIRFPDAEAEKENCKILIACEIGMLILNPRAVAVAVNEDLVDIKLNMDKILI